MIRIALMEEKYLDQADVIEKQNFSEPWSRKSYEDFLAREDTIFLAAVEEKTEELVGYIGVLTVPPEGDITSVSVKNTCRRLGIGTMLVQAMLRSAEERGVDTLFLEVREGNTAARTLYRHAGFEDVGLRKNYYSDPTEHAIIMKRTKE